MTESTCINIQAFFSSHNLSLKPDLSHVDRGFISVHDEEFKGGFVITSYSWGFEAGVRDWRMDDKVHWKRFGADTLTAQDEREIKERRKKSELETSERHQKVSQTVQSMLKRYLDQGSSPYFERKKLPWPPGVLIEPGRNSSEPLIRIPMVDDAGKVWNQQTIWPNGDRSFHSGARAKGLKFEFEGHFSPVVIGEGLSTVWAVSNALKVPGIVAFTVSNLESVLRDALQKTHASTIVLLCDWDESTFQAEGKNPGAIECKRLAEKYRVRVAFPWGDGDVWPLKNTDFCDLWMRAPSQISSALSNAKGFEEMGTLNNLIKRVGEKVTVEPEVVAELEVEVNDVKTSGEEGFRKPDYTYLIEPPTFEPANPFALKPALLPDRKGDEGKGAVMATLQNFRVLMTAIGATLRYNVISKRQEWFVAGVEASPDNYARVVYAHLEDACARVGFPDSKLDSYVTSLCDENQFNPVAVWIESTPWDKVERFKSLCETVTVAPEVERLRDVFLKRWMIMAVAAAYRPDGIAAPGMLVFQGPQNIGKTKWVLSLTPPELKLSKEGVIIDVKSPDSIRDAIGNWIVELGELDGTFSKSEQNALKAWLTKQSDTLRSPYAKVSNTFSRRTVFFGSVNQEFFLTDKTGNRRYWVIAVNKLNFDHGLDMQQIWAEVLTWYKAGEQWWPTEKEMREMNHSNEQFAELDPIEDALLHKFDWSQYGSDMTATQVAHAIGILDPTKADLRTLATLARRLSGGQTSRSKSRKKGRMLWVGKKL